ncbi:hypothetical protein GW17_00037059 [Ensete ventricosum]|nr:hypothetical protein GW17_00037059 [Ensete ventricosum]
MRCRLARALPLQEWQPWPRGYPLRPRSGQPPPATWPWVASPCGLAVDAAYARRRRPCRRQPCPRAAAIASGCPCKGLWLWPVASLQGALAAAGCPLQPASSWVVGPTWGLVAPPRGLRCENVARMRRTILRDSISAHAV